ncbi:MAG: DEAD/DEAH box helicase [Verrucomicrobiaceae bacterium]|nr:DEAD/DEAH box helicase [Verrucomicrobiaceae bacterium]
MLAITSSRGKMHEMQIPQEFQIAIRDEDEPEALFLLTVGILGDAAASVAENRELDAEVLASVGFAANYFDAFLSSRFRDEISGDVRLLASAAYYLGDRPGSSFVLARGLRAAQGESQTETLLRRALRNDWRNLAMPSHPLYLGWLNEIAALMGAHLAEGSDTARLIQILNWVRHLAYRSGTPRDLLLLDLTAAVALKRVKASAWTNLPAFSGLPKEVWARAIARSGFPKELWPSQLLLGKNNFFAGGSGVVQMPTSAGKTRSVEIVLRSGFLSNRAKLAVIVAPFRALCHEIAAGFRHSFSGEDVKINELTDVLQADFLDAIAELLGADAPTRKSILVLTPEKFLYILRQSSDLVNNIGIVVYDEAHQFDSGARGVIYELLLTEIKALLPANAQTVLVSAVIRNGRAVADWLIGPHAQIADGTGLLPTKRSIAFASWMESLGQLIFFDSSNFQKYDYFVPRVIEATALTVSRRENPRSFPERNEANDVALYFGIRLAPMGAVAIFCGTKATASGVAKRAVEIYRRGYHVPSPSAASDSQEITALHHLITENFGATSVLSGAAVLGVFVHHGNTPQGIRLCVEHAMQKGRIKLVACTSTLAQGVNLPIRYLIVCSTRQGGEPIKVRDFQNLMGRAGRAGMHTEGMVIFADPSVYDSRDWQFTASVNLLSPEYSEETTSSLLDVLKPFESRSGQIVPLTWQELATLILSSEDERSRFAVEDWRMNANFGFEPKEVIKDLRLRRKILASVESYLMANRGMASYTEYRTSVEALVKSTLAYHLASAQQREGLVGLVTSLADYLEAREPLPGKQALYAKTLLGIQSAKDVESWVAERTEQFSKVNPNSDWLRTFWPLLASSSDDKFFHTVTPEGFGLELAARWLDGEPYERLISLIGEKSATKPYGPNRRRKVAEDDVIKFCESVLGFDCSLILAAAIQFFRDGNNNDEVASSLLTFQKALKYGLPDPLSISCFEYGFADRVLCQKMANALHNAGFERSNFSSAVTAHREIIDATLRAYPSYFRELLSPIE